MPKTEVSLSPYAIKILNEILSDGKKAEINVKEKTGELMIFEVPKSNMKYRVNINNYRSFDSV